MAMYNREEFLRGEDSAKDPAVQQHLQQPKRQREPQGQRDNGQHPEGQHRQEGQQERHQSPQQQMSLSVTLFEANSEAGGRSQSSSSKGAATTSAATPPAAPGPMGTASGLPLSMSSPSSSSSAATASSQRPPVHAVASSDDSSGCSVDHVVDAPALDVAQGPSACRSEIPNRNSSSGSSRRGGYCDCIVAVRRVCYDGLQYVERCKARSLEAIMYSFERYAAVVYKYPWLVLIASVLLTAALSVGVFRRTAERDVYRLYSLKVSPSQKTKEKIFSAVPPDRVILVIVESETGDLLQQEALQELANLRAALQSLTIERDAVKRDEYNHELKRDFDRTKYPPRLTYQDLCAIDAQKQCVSASVLDLYPEPAAYGRIPLLIQSSDNPVILNARTGRAFRADSILAKYELQPVAAGQPEQQVVKAQVALLKMNFRGDEAWRPFVAAFEEQVTQYVLDHRKLNPHLLLTPRTERSAADELHRASVWDLPHWLMLVGAGTLVSVYTSVVNSSLSYRTKMLPSLMGALASFLGYLGGAGAVYLCGVRHTSPADSTPFLALGIGVDDLFVIINAYSLTYLYKDPQQRIISAVRDAGLSISLTTLTNVITFMIGAVCPYYSISGFCLVTAGALFWGYVMCLTFFLAFLCIDARREACKQSLIHALLCKETPRQGHPPTVSAITSMAAPGALPLDATTPPQRHEEQAAVTSNDREAAAAGAQQGNVRRGEDLEDVIGARTAAGGPEFLAEPTEKPGTAGSAAAAPGGATLQRAEVQQILHEESSRGSASSQVAWYKEEALTTHELAALMVLYGKHERLRAAEGRRSMWPAAAFPVKGKAGCYMCPVLHTAREGTPHCSSGGNRGLESPQETNQSSSQPKDDATFDNGRHPSENTYFLHTNSQSSNGPGKGLGDLTRKSVDPTTVAQSTSWKTQQGDEGGSRPRGRPTSEETALQLQHFQRELEENPERLLSLYHPEPRGNPGRIWRLFFRDYYSRLFERTWVKLCILMGFLTFTGVAIYGTTRLEYGFSLKDITPNVSFLRDFYEKHEKYFSNYGDEVVVFFPGTAHLQSRSVQKEYLTIVNEIQNTEDVTVVSDGLSVFLQSAPNQPPDEDRRQFLVALQTWLEQDPIGRNFERDFQFSSQGELLWAKFSCWMRLLDNSTARYNLLQRLKETVQTAGPSLGGDVYTSLAVIWESDPRLLSFTLTNLAIALASILGVSLLMIPNLASAALVVAAVTFVDLCLFGMMGLIHLHLSMISMVILLISVGYSVDFTLHVAHTFTHCVGPNREDRVSETMVVMGAPVTHGMISTMLAVLALGGTPRYILQVFFKMMLMVVSFSYAAGMILLPTALSLAGPTRRHSRRSAKKTCPSHLYPAVSVKPAETPLCT